MATASHSICVIARQSTLLQRAEALAKTLQLPFVPAENYQNSKQGPWQKFLKQQADFVLLLENSGQESVLKLWDSVNSSWVYVDFVAGSADHRRKFGGGTGQLIAKAVGVKASIKPKVLDATAGMGGDAFVLASLGCEVKMLERNPIVHALLADGLDRLQNRIEPDLKPIAAKMFLAWGNSLECLQAQAEQFSPDVIYLDPMYPSRKKSASVKKAMAAFHRLVGEDGDSNPLLAAALAANPARVVVKRPKGAECIAGRKPSHQVESKNSRYDVYVLRALTET